MLDQLRQAGFAVHPHVGVSGYDYCGGKPFDIQIKTVELLTENPRAYVLNSMGTGKTKSVLWAFDYLRRVNGAHRMLVVAPLSTLRFVWAHEIFKTVPHLRYAVLHGSKEKRMAALQQDADIYIINHDGLGLMMHHIIARTDIDVLCIDELGVYRNRSQRSRHAEHVSRAKPIVWGLTGSPTPNSPTDAFQEAKIITPHTVPKYFGHFRDQVMIRINQFKWIPKREANDVVFRTLKPNVRFTLDDVTELPPFVSRTVDVPMGPKQAKVYNEIKRVAYSMVQSGEIKASNAGAVMSKLLQISLGWVYLNDGTVYRFDGDARLQTLVELVDASTNKVLIFVPFKHALAGVTEALTSAGKKVAEVSGDTPPLERDKIFRAFQDSDEPEIINAHPQCLAHGVTLTRADTVIWFGPITSTEIYEQANARIRRVGQLHKQLFLHMQATPIEKHTYSLLGRKIIQQDDLLLMLEKESWEDEGDNVS